MNLTFDFIRFYFQSQAKLDAQTRILAAMFGFGLAALCWILCNYYTRLWNKFYHLTLMQRVLCMFASLLTFFFVTAFVGFAVLKDVTLQQIANWESGLKENPKFNDKVFRIAYYEVKTLNTEDFSNYPPPEQGGRLFPSNESDSRQRAGEVYAAEAYGNFANLHPFLAAIILSKSSKISRAVKDHMDTFFRNGGKTYEVSEGVRLAALLIRNDLEERAPRVVSIARIVLVVAFLLVQSVPFGLIGWNAYRHLSIKSD